MTDIKIAVTGLGIISGQGVGADQTLRNLLSPALRLGRVSLFYTTLEMPVCEAPLTNEELAATVAQGDTNNVTKQHCHTRTAMLGMIAAKEALRDADLPQGLRIGLVSATSVAGMDNTERFYRQYVQDPANVNIDYLKGHDTGDSTNAIAKYCGITEFKTTVSTACSSSTNAIIFGAGLIKAGLLDVVVAGGTDALCASTLNGFNSLKILDSEPCRPFDQTRAGLNLGEGAGYIVLQREDTLRRKDLYAYLSGYGNATDAFHQTATSENGQGAYLAMNEALRTAGIKPQDIDYINAHGTGTPNNDASEGAALLRIFTDEANAQSIPPFSSTKPLTGHTLAASGGIEAVFCLLALQHGLLYPNLNFKTPFDRRLIPQTTLQHGKTLYNIMSNSFGFGGNSSSIIFSKKISQ
jgi:3-oxoacyl-[acyl-carrier-protein] synthase-1